MYTHDTTGAEDGPNPSGFETNERGPNAQYQRGVN
jgi:hypothetical protein